MPFSPVGPNTTPPTSQTAPAESGARIPRFSLAMGWWSMVSSMFYLYLAGLVSALVGPVQAVIGIVLTVVVYGYINQQLSRYAIRTGFGVEELSRIIFGRVGSVLATLVFAATALYYGVFEGSIIAATLHAYTQDSLGWSLNVWYLVVVLYSTPLVFGGVRNWLDRLNGVLLPLYVAGLVAAVVVAAVQGAPAGLGAVAVPAIPLDAGGPGWLLAFGVYMGVWILMMYTMDFARLGREEDAAFHGTVTFGYVFYACAFLVNGLIGIFLTHALRHFLGAEITEGGVAVAMVQVMGIFAVLLVWISQTRINTANYYLASINLQTLGAQVLRIRAPRVVWTLVGSVIMYLMMLTDVFSYLLTALSWQGVLITAWVAIALVHLTLERRAGAVSSNPGEHLAAVSVPGVAAWAIASAVGLSIIETAPAWATTWGPILTALVAAGAYAGFRLSVPAR